VRHTISIVCELYCLSYISAHRRAQTSIFLLSVRLCNTMKAWEPPEPSKTTCSLGRTMNSLDESEFVPCTVQDKLIQYGSLSSSLCLKPGVW
jgi:hypothetical protein